MLQFNLTAEGFTASCSQDGNDGLALVKREQPDLLLLDLMLPRLDGLEICRRLKADPLTEDIPVVIVYAKGHESDIVLGLGLGADDYITKPFSSAELVKAVQTRLEKQRIIEKERLQAISRRLVALQETERRHIVAELNGPIAICSPG